MHKDLDREIKVLVLLDYLGCEKVAPVFAKMHYWDFVVSLADALEKYGRLTDKQVAAVCSSIDKHTGIHCKILDKLSHETMYNRGGGVSCNSRTTVDHDYGKLEVIQLYDLPFNSGDVVELELLPYNEHSVVIYYNNNPYKIPKPSCVDKAGSYVFNYKRTNVKGFLTLVENVV